jgi:TetR/AcrR family transcriptional repressor of nem operon
MKPESETKRKLLETAVELIWESSYGSVSVDDICTKAGVNKSALLDPGPFTGTAY